MDNQIKYWLDGSHEDISTAGILIDKERYLHGLFFCHLSIEKILKAIFVKVHNDFPPKTHNLIYLCNLNGIDLTDDRKEFFAILMKYQISGRYPDAAGVIPQSSLVHQYLNSTEEVLKWLVQKLNQL